MPNTNDIAGRGAKGSLLRLPPDLRERLKEKAKIERRSMNSQIIVLLEQALPAENEKADAAATASAQ